MAPYGVVFQLLALVHERTTLWTKQELQSVKGGDQARIRPC